MQVSEIAEMDVVKSRKGCGVAVVTDGDLKCPLCATTAACSLQQFTSSPANARRSFPSPKKTPNSRKQWWCTQRIWSGCGGAWYFTWARYGTRPRNLGSKLRKGSQCAQSARKVTGGRCRWKGGRRREQPPAAASRQSRRPLASVGCLCCSWVTWVLAEDGEWKVRRNLNITCR